MHQAASRARTDRRPVSAATRGPPCARIVALRALMCATLRARVRWRYGGRCAIFLSREYQPERREPKSLPSRAPLSLPSGRAQAALHDPHRMAGRGHQPRLDPPPHRHVRRRAPAALGLPRATDLLRPSRLHLPRRPARPCRRARRVRRSPSRGALPARRAPARTPLALRRALRRRVRDPRPRVLRAGGDGSPRLLPLPPLW
eukprot:1214256-Prymnesium_polylepis.1